MDWFKNDELFRQELETGHDWARLVVTRLNEAGVPAVLTPLAWRDNIDERHAFSNEVDILVPSPDGDIPIESKSRNLFFTDVPVSYPFDTVFVDTVSGWDKKAVKPFAVVFTSQESGSMLVLPSRSPTIKWTTSVAFDRVRGVRDRWYEVPYNALVPFQTLINSLQKRILTTTSP